MKKLLLLELLICLAMVTQAQTRGQEPVSIPAGVTMQDYAFAYTDVGVRCYLAAAVGFQGNDVYVRGIERSSPNGVIKGTLSGTTVTFPGDQYLGLSYDDDETYLQDEVTMTYDPADGSFTVNKSLVFAYYYRSWSYYFESDGKLVKSVNQVATPANPEILTISNYSIKYTTPLLATDGTGLMASKLSYQFYYDEGGVVKPLVFTSAKYGLSSDMTTIPFGFSGNDNFHMDQYILNKFDDWKSWNRIGIKSIYTGGGATRETDIQWFGINALLTEAYINGYESPVANKNNNNYRNITTPSDANYEIYSVEWYNASGYTALTDGETFAKGKSYYMYVTLKAINGYSFTEGCAIYLDDTQDKIDPSYSLKSYDGQYFFFATKKEEAKPEFDPTYITEQPEGEEKLYRRTGDEIYGNSTSNSHYTQNQIAKIIFAPDGKTIYFENFMPALINSSRPNTYIRGTISDDGKTVHVPLLTQAVRIWDSNDDAYTITTWGSETTFKDGNTYDPNVTEAVFNIEDGKLILQGSSGDPEKFGTDEFTATGISTMWTDDYLWGGSFTWNTVFTPYVEPELTFNALEDQNLTYLSEEGDAIGTARPMISGDLGDQYNTVALYLSNTSLVNKEDPSNTLPLAINNNVEITNNPVITVGGTDIMCTENIDDYGNQPINTIVGEHQYVYIDNFGTEEDFAAVKDVLAGKIAVCNRGEISFYVKANAAMANGAIGLIVVNNQEGTVTMSLTGYEYSNPAVAITKADGELLKNNATFVDGDAPYYLGTLTVTDRISPTYGENEDVYFQYGFRAHDDLDDNIIAKVLDWTNAVPGATYEARITYTATSYAYQPGFSEWYKFAVIPSDVVTTLTLKVPDDNSSVEDITSARRDDVRRYNLLGQPVGADYRGIVIQNGKKYIVR